MLNIVVDDLSGAQARNLVRLHLSGMQANSPPDHVFALDVSGLAAPDVTVWIAWEGEVAVGMAALKELGDGRGEIKSMRTDPQHLRKGVASALLEHIIAEARTRELQGLSLETGRAPSFDPALALYRKAGFSDGDAFGEYQPTPFNQFLHLSL